MHTPTNHSSFLSTRRGKLTLALVCLAGFLDFIDTTIVNVALPSIREHLHFSAQNLQWTVSGYLLTYGGFLLLGGRAADLLGRRRLLIAGTSLFGLSSLIGGLAAGEAMLIAARLMQGLGAAMMTPAALSILTTSFTEGHDRVKAIGVWSGTIPLASAVGVLAGGLLSQEAGWRWVFFVNLPVCAVVITGARKVLATERPKVVKDIDVLGAILPTASALALVYALVNAPEVGWGSARTIAELAVAVLLMGAFVVNEHRHSNPLFPLSIFRVPGLAAADATQVIAQAGFLSLFFFITLYMQNVLGLSPIEAGAAYIPVTIGVGISSGISTQLLPRIGSRPLIVAGTLIGAVGLFWLSRIPANGSYVTDVLPGLVGDGARSRRSVRRRPERGQRRRPRRAGRTSGGADQRLVHPRRGARPRDPLRDRHQPHAPPARRARRAARGAHLRIRPRAPGVQPVPAGCGRDRRSDRQHPRPATAEPGAGSGGRRRLRVKPGDRSERRAPGHWGPPSLSLIEARLLRPARCPPARPPPARRGTAPAGRSS
jgi:EmrB/QacA subfamily drug resistance transporter